MVEDRSSLKKVNTVKEIGGYFEMETYLLPMIHEDAILLNTARNCLAYLIQVRKIGVIWLPKFLCDSIPLICKEYGVCIKTFSIDINFKPILTDVKPHEWVYIVNYYGQISNDYIMKVKEKHDNLIVDNVQAYYQMPVNGVDTIYTCRKFFGVPDGAILYTDVREKLSLDRDTSIYRLTHLVGRYEASASKYYETYINNENDFVNEKPKEMSRFTYNLLHSLDYDKIKQKRIENYQFMLSKLTDKNELDLRVIPIVPFMYPLLLRKGKDIRKKLVEKGVYIPVLWPNVLMECKEDELEYDLAGNILPLPIDQRYSTEDMQRIVDIILE